MTMTEIMVAFLILLLCILALTNCMNLASNLLKKSKDLDKKHESVQNMLVTGTPSVISTDGNYTYELSDGTTTINLQVGKETVQYTSTEDLDNADKIYHIYSSVS